MNLNWRRFQVFSWGPVNFHVDEDGDLLIIVRRPYFGWQYAYTLFSETPSPIFEWRLALGWIEVRRFLEPEHAHRELERRRLVWEAKHRDDRSVGLTD